MWLKSFKENKDKKFQGNGSRWFLEMRNIGYPCKNGKNTL